MEKMKAADSFKQLRFRKSLNRLCLRSLVLLLLSSCDNKPSVEAIQNPVRIGHSENTYDLASSVDTKGYDERGIYKHFDCPDDLSFAPIDLRYWNKTPAISGVLPSNEDTRNGMAILHYEGYRDARPFYLNLPRLAYIYRPSQRKKEMVVVIQIVQTSMDTVVGYRYLSGGCGGSLFRDFHFLTEEEIKKEMH